MRRFAIPIALMLFTTAFLLGQDSTPKIEVGLGYSYSRAGVPNSTSRVNMNGLVIDATTSVNRWLGIQAEFGTHYHCISGCWIEGMRAENPDERNDSLSFFAGPKITLGRSRRVSPWVHSVFGATRIIYTNWIIDRRMSTSGFGMALGGGIDMPLSKLTVRAVQVDYARYAGDPKPFNNVRISGGFVFRIGHRKN